MCISAFNSTSITMLISVTLHVMIFGFLLKELKVGSLVFNKVMKHSHRMGGKLEERWKGPFEVVKIMPKGRYQLKSQSGTILAKLIHGTLLKEYRQCMDGESKDNQSNQTDDGITSANSPPSKLSQQCQNEVVCLI